jgi:ATP-binding cassette, subfamily B, multidrug efflux pump
MTGPHSGSPRADEDDVIATTGREARRGSFGPGGGAGMPAEKSRDFGTSIRRLGTILGPEAPLLVLSLVLTVASVVLVVLGPRLLGGATDLIVDGVRGDGIDFGQLHRTLFVIAAIYLGSWVLSYSQAYLLAGVIQRSRSRSIDSRCDTSTVNLEATSSVGSRTTSTISPRACSRRRVRSSARCSRLSAWRR